MSTPLQISFKALLRIVISADERETIVLFSFDSIISMPLLIVFGNTCIHLEYLSPFSNIPVEILPAASKSFLAQQRIQLRQEFFLKYFSPHKPSTIVPRPCLVRCKSTLRSHSRA